MLAAKSPISAPDELDDYPEDGFQHLAAAEAAHYWFTARNRIIRASLAEVLGDLRGRAVLDIGCGTGFVLADLERAGMVSTGVDMHPDAVARARQRLVGTAVCARASQLDQWGCYDAVLLCDVIEHSANDVGLLAEAGRLAKLGGCILVTVPAFRSLWTEIDDMAGHKRRYTARLLHSSLKRAGLAPVFIRYFNILSLPLQFLQRLAARGRSDVASLRAVADRVPPAPMNKLLGWMALADLPLGRLGIPAGGSLIAVAQPASIEGSQD